MSFDDCEGLYKACTGRESDLNNVLAAQHVRHVRGEVHTSCVRERLMVQGSSAFRMSSSRQLRLIASVQLRRRVAHFGICLRSRGKSSLSAFSFFIAYIFANSCARVDDIGSSAPRWSSFRTKPVSKSICNLFFFFLGNPSTSVDSVAIDPVSVGALML